MRVTILEPATGEPLVVEKSWSKEGRSGVIRTQKCQYETKRFRGQGRINVGKDRSYAPGIYEVDADDLLLLNQFGELKLVNSPELHLIEAFATEL